MHIEGAVDPAFAAVGDAFRDNFATRGEVGAAVCVVVGGTTVVDLWGGWADAAATRPWGPDTLVNAFSVGKGFLAVLAAQAAGRGRLDLDAPVGRAWPEFEAAGKAAITARQLLSHQAGLPALRAPVPAAELYDWAAMTGRLAAEAPWWEPGTAHGYHVNTYGLLVGELLRRVTGRRPGDLLRTELAGPLGADVHLGLAPEHDARTAEFLWPGDPPGRPDPEVTGVDLMRFNTYFNPPTVSGAGVVNSRSWRAAELPSTNTHASARGVARIYAALAAGGALDGVRVVDPDALAAATAEQVHGPDLVLERVTRFGLGFQLTQGERPLGPAESGFGHFGAGGSVGFCHPDTGVAMGYVMNQLGPRWQNPRNRALIDAVFASL